MRRRPVCILCMLLVVFLCVTDWLGFSLIRGNPLPQSVQTWIRKHPESTICGEVVRCRENEDFQSVYLRNTYLIYNSEKVSIDNIKVYLKQKKNHSGNSDVDKLLAGSLVLVSGKLEEVQSPTNPGEFDSKAYYGYNDNCKCTASSIQVDGSNAHASSDTRCDTFQCHCGA